MSTDRKIRELEESIKKMQKDNSRPFGDYSEKSNPASDLLQFFIGLILLGAGLFWVFQKAIVSTSFSQMMLGNFAVPNGAVIIPLLIGIVMLFFCEKRIFGWIVTVLGVLIILLTIIMSVNISFSRTTLFDYIIMFGFIAAGCGLLLKTLFKKRG